MNEVNHNMVMPLKIDFKFVGGKVKILDFGNGLGAGLGYFDSQAIIEKLLYDILDSTGASIVPVFGELPRDILFSKVAKFPLVNRDLKLHESSLLINDLKGHNGRLFPYCDKARVSAVVSNFWSSKSSNIVATPLSFIALEMYKIFWYMLLDKTISSESESEFVFWKDHDGDAWVDVSKIDSSTGYFVKAVSRSQGGAQDVFYCANKDDLQDNLKGLAAKHQRSHGRGKIFVIEPAYSTVRMRGNRDYNVTGRAFLTLVYDPNSNNLSVKIAGAKWIFPKEKFESGFITSSQMISNVGESICAAPLTVKELSFLTKGLMVYKNAFIKCFEENDLFLACKSHPYMYSFEKTVLKNSFYKVMLEDLYGQSGPSYDCGAIYSIVVSAFITSRFFERFVAFNQMYMCNYSEIFVTNSNDLVNNIHELMLAIMFLQELSKHPKGHKTFFCQHKPFSCFISNERKISFWLRKMINIYVKKNKSEYSRSTVSLISDSIFYSALRGRACALKKVFSRDDFLQAIDPDEYLVGSMKTLEEREYIQRLNYIIGVPSIHVIEDSTFVLKKSWLAQLGSDAKLDLKSNLLQVNSW